MASQAEPFRRCLQEYPDMLPSPRTPRLSVERLLSKISPFQVCSPLHGALSPTFCVSNRSVSTICMTRCLPLLCTLAVWLMASLFAPERATAQPVLSFSDTLNVAPGDTVRLGLEATVARALAASPEVDQRQAERRFARARLSEARASRFLTEFEASTAHSYAPSLDRAGLDLSENLNYLSPRVENDWSAPQPFNRLAVRALQPIYTWGELSGSIRAARYGVRVEDARVSEKALEVAFRTGELYYTALLTDALNRLADETGRALARAKRELNNLLQEGDESVDEADLFQLQLTEQEYRRRLVEVEQRQATVRAGLARQLFLPEQSVVLPEAGELVPLDFSLSSDSLNYYIALALQNRPELEQARAGLNARQALVDVAESDYYPKFGLQASYSVNYTPGRFNPDNAFISDSYNGQGTRTGIGFQQNLNFLQTKARVEQAEAELNEVRYQQEAAQQLIRFEVEQAFRDVLIAQNSVASRDTSVNLTEEWLRTEQINFDLDFGNTENLVDAVQANLEAEALYYEAVQRYNVAVLRLLRASGVLIRRLQSGMLLGP